MRIYNNRTWEDFKTRSSRALGNVEQTTGKGLGSVDLIYGNDNEDKNERIQTRGRHRRTTSSV